MKVAILVIALFALTAFAQEEQEYFGLPSRQQIGNGFKTAGNIAGKVSGPLSTAGGVINRLPPVQVGPVNTRVVGAGLAGAGVATGIASKGFNYVGNKLGGREVEEEFEFIDEPVEYVDVEAVEDFNLPNRQQVANGFHKAGNIAGTVSNVAGKVSNYAGKASSGLHWVGNKIGGKELEDEDEYVVVYLDEADEVADEYYQEFVDEQLVDDSQEYEVEFAKTVPNDAPQPRVKVACIRTVDGKPVSPKTLAQIHQKLNKGQQTELEEEYADEEDLYVEFIDEPLESDDGSLEYDFVCYDAEEVEFFGLPSFGQIKSGASNLANKGISAGKNLVNKGISAGKNVAHSALNTGAKAANAVSRGANSLANGAAKVASGTGKVAKVAGTVSKVSKGVQVGAGAVSAGARFIPHPIARGVSAGAGAVSKGAGAVSKVSGQLAKGTGAASKIAKGVSTVSRGVSKGAAAAGRGLSKAAGKVGGRGREIEFFADEPVEYVYYHPVEYVYEPVEFVYEPVEFIDEPVEFVDFDAVEDFNLPNRQQVANGFHKAGNIAGTVSNVAGKVSNYAGKASSGLHWVGNKIGGKELEDEYVIVYLDEPVDLAEFVDVDAVEDFNLSNRQ